MRKTKSIIILTIAAALTFSLGACNTNGDNSSDKGFFGNLFGSKEDYGTIELDYSELNLTVGESAIVTATTSKEDVKVVWSTADVGVVSVYNGLVKGLAEGTTTLIATIEGSETKATCDVIVKAEAFESLQNIQAFVGEGDISVAVNTNDNYTIQAERLENGKYTAADELLKGVKFSTDVAGTYRLTYTVGNETATRFVYVNEEKAFKEFMVVDAFDGSTEFKSHVSQSSVDVLINPECSIENSQYVEEDVSAELEAAGYNGQIHNNMLYRIEKEVVKFGWGGTYFYFDITPKNADVFDNLDTFDSGAYLSLWYRVQCDADGNGYKPVTQCFNYLYRENKSGLSLILRNQNVTAINGGNGWFNWRLNLASMGELVGTERFIFNIGQWAAGGKFMVDLYGLEIVSPLYDKLIEGREVEEGTRIEYQLPNPGIQNYSCEFNGIFDGDTQLVEGEDYNFYDYAGDRYIVDLKVGDYTVKYTVYGKGLQTNSENGLVIESALKVKAPVYTNPAVYAGVDGTSEDVSWFQSGSWGTISQANTTTVETITDEDYAALLKAGYQGVLDKRTVNRANVKATSVNGDNTRGAFGMIFNFTENHRLFNSSSQAGVKNNYYLSIWVKASETIGSDTRFAAYDTGVMAQATYGDYNWITLNANEWTEIRLPISHVAATLYYIQQAGGSTPSMGFYFASILTKNDIYVDIYSAELCMNSIKVQEGESVDATFYGAAFSSDAQLEEIAVYEGQNKLVEGVDYTLEDNKVLGLTKGEYELRYYISAKLYLDDSYVARKITITKPINNAVLIDDMATNGSVTVWVENSPMTAKLANCTQVDTATDTISDAEYAALLAAGYKGVKTDKTVQNVNFGTYDSLQYVYFQFDKTINHELIQAGVQNKFSDVYVSVWLKCNKEIAYATYKAIIAQNAQHVALLDYTWTAASAEQWIEIQLPFKWLAETWYYTGNGYWNENDTLAYGFGFENARTNYLNNATFTIYSMELAHVGKEGSQGVGTSLSIPSALFGSDFDVEIYQGETKLVNGTDYTLADNKVNGLVKGKYTVVYTLLGEKFTAGQTFKLSLEILNPLSSVMMLSDMSKGNDATAYVTAGWTSDPLTDASRTRIDGTVYTMTDAERAALTAAGYDGEDMGNTANRFTFASSYPNSKRQSVLIPFNSLYSNEMFQKIGKEQSNTDLYVSVWLKANKEIYSGSIFGIVAGEQSQIPASFGWTGTTLKADTWFELRLPLGGNTSFGYAYGYALGVNSITKTENIVGGMYMYECHWDQLAGAILDIASVELRVYDKTTTAGVATNVGISEAVFGSYNIAILNSNGEDVTSTCAVSGTNVTVSTAGVYTIVYKMTSNSFVEGVTMKAKLIVS